jgi:hypothetical protein
VGLNDVRPHDWQPLLQVKWGPEKDRLDMEEGVGVGVDVPHSGAPTVRRGDRVRQRVGAMCPLVA